MVADLSIAFVTGWFLPLPFLLVVYAVRQLKSYFSDAADINLE